MRTVCQENLKHAQKFRKQAYNKDFKPRNYTTGDKVWLNSKFIKTKQNEKFKTKFFESFQVLNPVDKQAYKFKLSRKWKIHNVFYVSLLEQDIKKRAGRQKRDGIKV